jgi:hypothetical protein
VLATLLAVGLALLVYRRFNAMQRGAEGSALSDIAALEV